MRYLHNGICTENACAGACQETLLFYYLLISYGYSIHPKLMVRGQRGDDSPPIDLVPPRVVIWYETTLGT